MGINAYTLWNSVPSASPFQFQWLGGSTVAATLSGTGNLNVTGTLTAGRNAVQQSLSSDQLHQVRRLYLYLQM